MAIIDSGEITARSEQKLKKELAARLVWETLKRYRFYKGSEMALSSPAWKAEWAEICGAMAILLDDTQDE